ILYTTLYAINKNKNIPIIENTNNTKNMSSSSPTAEKLTQVTLEKQTVEHISPRPFLNDLRGALPSGFSPSFGVPTTPGYYIHPNHKPHQQQHPHNIQDIIQYITENAHRHKELVREEQKIVNTQNSIDNDKFKLYGTIQTPRQRQQDFYFSRQHFPQDPFFAFKPQDPSDINLLAPSSFRFAPSIVTSSFYKNRQKLLHEAETLSKNISSDLLRKPISLTLNIYSSPYEDQLGSEKRLQFQGPGITPRYRYPFIGLQGRPLLKRKRMVVHLNVYPDAVRGQSNSEDNTEGSRYQQK
ncbi:hypothetical protein ILUMI_08387, partial [Ignelater luminosus]